MLFVKSLRLWTALHQYTNNTPRKRRELQPFVFLVKDEIVQISMIQPQSDVALIYLKYMNKMCFH